MKEKGDNLLSRPVLYVTQKKRKKMVQLREPTGTTWRVSSNFVQRLGELFWSFQVYQKTLTKSHDNSRLFPWEKRRL